MSKTNTKDFLDLEAWQLAHSLMLDIYQLVKLLPENEKYNRISQILRSASSVPANIAEGHGRYYFQENIAFCRKARGSLSETKNHLVAIMGLKQAPETKCQELISKCDEARKVLNGYIRYLHSKKPKE